MLSTTTASKARRDRERTETRDLILAAAREMFTEHGIEAVTMRAIAKRIGYTPTAIYHHFRDKHSLLSELCRVDFLNLAQVFIRIGRIDDPVERLRRIGRAYVDFGLEHPGPYRFMFMTPKPSTVYGTGIEHGNPDQDAYAFVRMTVSEGINAGLFRPEFSDPDQLAQIFWAGAHGVVSLHIAKCNDPWIDWSDVRMTAYAICDTVLRGVLRHSD